MTDLYILVAGNSVNTKPRYLLQGRAEALEHLLSLVRPTPAESRAAHAFLAGERDELKLVGPLDPKTGRPAPDLALYSVNLYLGV